MIRIYQTSCFEEEKLRAYHKDPDWNKVKDLCGTTFDKNGASHNQGKFGEANEAVLKIMEKHNCFD